MPNEKDWTEAQKKLVTQTEKGEIVWVVVPGLVRENDILGDAYGAHVANRFLAVYEYTYRVYTDEHTWTEETDVATEFVDEHGKLQWQWPKLPFRQQLLDAIRYRLSGAHEFLDAFLP